MKFYNLENSNIYPESHHYCPHLEPLKSKKKINLINNFEFLYFFFGFLGFLQTLKDYS